MPGTGKTAICLEVLEQLRSTSSFVLVHVNAMRLGAPSQIFKEIADDLLPDRASSNGARNALARYFSTRQAEDPVIVLLIDEVDCLMTSNQAVLYNVFDWLAIPRARLVLAAISNTMDLPERMLPRVASRFHIERVDFAPYTKSQIYEILRCRLQGQHALDSFGDVVLKLCAARVAGSSGDIRKALQVCRRAIEAHLETQRAGTITLADLQIAEQDLVCANPALKMIMGLSSQTRRFLAAAVIELRRTGADAVPIREAGRCFQKLLSMVGVDSERGHSDAYSLESDFARSEMDDAVWLLVQRLQAMSIMVKQNKSISSADVLSNPLVSLGSLSVDDVAAALLRVEDDSTIRDLLQSDQTSVDIDDRTETNTEPNRYRHEIVDLTVGDDARAVLEPGSVASDVEASSWQPDVEIVRKQPTAAASAGIDDARPVVDRVSLASDVEAASWQPDVEIVREQPTAAESAVRSALAKFGAVRKHTRSALAVTSSTAAGSDAAPCATAASSTAPHPVFKSSPVPISLNKILPADVPRRHAAHEEVRYTTN